MNTTKHIPREHYNALVNLLDARRDMKDRHNAEFELVKGPAHNLNTKLELKNKQKAELLPLNLAIDALNEVGE